MYPIIAKSRREHWILTFLNSLLSIVEHCEEVVELRETSRRPKRLPTVPTHVSRGLGRGRGGCGVIKLGGFRRGLMGGGVEWPLTNYAVLFIIKGLERRGERERER